MSDRIPPSTEELAVASYRKSSFSGGGGNECLEVARVRSWACIRDSKDPDGPVLPFTAAAFRAFLADVVEGRLSR